jgi:hypothetical protein
MTLALVVATATLSAVAGTAAVQAAETTTVARAEQCTDARHDFRRAKARKIRYREAGRFRAARRAAEAQANAKTRIERYCGPSKAQVQQNGMNQASHKTDVYQSLLGDLRLDLLPVDVGTAITGIVSSAVDELAVLQMLMGEAATTDNALVVLHQIQAYQPAAFVGVLDGLLTGLDGLPAADQITSLLEGVLAGTTAGGVDLGQLTDLGLGLQSLLGVLDGFVPSGQVGQLGDLSSAVDSVLGQFDTNVVPAAGLLDALVTQSPDLALLDPAGLTEVVVALLGQLGTGGLPTLATLPTDPTELLSLATSLLSTGPLADLVNGLLGGLLGGLL